jgi:hypothetical protein
MAELAADNILDVFAGKLPRCCANPAVVMRGKIDQQSVETK